MAEEINELRKRIASTSLGINRIPKRTKREFIDLAEAEFVGDYGLCLKDLLDHYKMSFLIESHAQRIYEIERIIHSLIAPEQSKDKSKQITTLSGRKIEKKEVNKE